MTDILYDSVTELTLAEANLEVMSFLLILDRFV